MKPMKSQTPSEAEGSVCSADLSWNAFRQSVARWKDLAVSILLGISAGVLIGKPPFRTISLVRQGKTCLRSMVSKRVDFCRAGKIEGIGRLSMLRRMLASLGLSALLAPLGRGADNRGQDRSLLWRLAQRNAAHGARIARGARHSYPRGRGQSHAKGRGSPLYELLHLRHAGAAGVDQANPAGWPAGDLFCRVRPGHDDRQAARPPTCIGISRC